MRSLALLLPVIFALVLGCGDNPKSETKAPEDSVQRALKETRVDDALRIAQAALLKNPDDPDALTDAARATAANGERENASDLLAQAARAAKFSPSSRVELCVSAFLELGRVYPAIDLLEEAVRSDPSQHKLQRTLYGLYGEAGRTDQMLTHFQAIIKSRKFDVPVLMAFTDTSQRLFPLDSVKEIIKRNPKDHRVKLALAQSQRDNQRFTEAESTLRTIIDHHPEFGPAHASLGRLPSVQQATDVDFQKWMTSASPYCKSQADYWIAVGDRHVQTDNDKAALACYYAAAQLQPNLPTAWIQISRILRQNHAAPIASSTSNSAEQIIKECDQWASGLFSVRQDLERFGGRHESSQRIAADIARSLNKMGRLWEAEAWAAIATTLANDPDPSLAKLRDEIIAKLRKNQAWSSPPNLNAIDAFKGSPDDNPGKLKRSTFPAKNHITSNSDIQLQLSDETDQRGLVLLATEYPDIASSLIYSLGAGGGALDFDLDGNPDLIFRSGGKIFEKMPPPNSLLRNLDGHFASIVTDTGCGETGGGQGVAIGDYNEDGFPDIFIANVGPNRLLRNNGDGTFSDDSQAMGDIANQWTTCGAFVDLNHDGITDLIAVNYCDLDSDVDQPCRNGSVVVPCHPAKFPADSDQVFIGDGKGGFQARFQQNSHPLLPGRGLGVVAGSLDSSKSSAFVANDMTTNHFLQITDNELVESGVLSGLSVDGQSRTQASMGIASGDFDGDLDLDFYVTGFAREYNILYDQESPGLWNDVTSRLRLVEPTRMTVGFGTQAVDLDSDGIIELAITNGHIGDFGPDQPPLAQAFQLMKRTDKTGFEQVDLEHNGVYFRNKHIGRAMFKIDVDQDLADDLIITHQNVAPVLLSNRTKTENQRIGFQLIGTTSGRDAIGAKVTFVADGKTRAMWLLSGDGYMCSNERILRAGVGACERVEKMQVAWPSGNVESFGSLHSGHLHVLVEQSGKPFTAF